MRKSLLPISVSRIIKVGPYHAGVSILNGKLAPILDAACEAAGIARMRVHDLRHAHASLWLMSGGSLADVQRNLGHSTPVLTSETYGHIGEDHRIREADQRLSLGLQRQVRRASNPTERNAEESS